MKRKTIEEKKIEFVKEKFAIPNDVEIKNVIQVSAEQYWNKYSDMEEISIVVIEAIYNNENIKIIFYQGIGYRDSEILSKVIIIDDSDDISIDTSLYYAESNPKYSNLKDFISFKVISYDSNTTPEYKEAFCEYDREYIANVAYELEELSFFIINLKIDRNKYSAEKLAELEKILSEFK